MKPSIALHDIHKLELTPIQHSPPRSESHGRPKCGEYWCRDLVATNVHGEKFTIPLFGEHAAALLLKGEAFDLPVPAVANAHSDLPF